MKIIETNRLILRHFELADLNTLFELYSDPDTIRFIPDAPQNLQETKKELEWHMQGHPKFPELGLWATIHKETSLFIGRCGLLPWEIDGQREVEVAYMIKREYWGQGLATEAAQAIQQYAFETLNIWRLICLVDKQNLASIKVAEHMGMRFERDSHDAIGPFSVYATDRLSAVG